MAQLVNHRRFLGKSYKLDHASCDNAKAVRKMPPAHAPTDRMCLSNSLSTSLHAAETYASGVRLLYLSDKAICSITTSYCAIFLLGLPQTSIAATEYLLNCFGAVAMSLLCCLAALSIQGCLPMMFVCSNMVGQGYFSRSVWRVYCSELTLLAVCVPACPTVRSLRK